MRKAAKRVFARAHPGIGYVPRRSEYHQLGTTLVDVVLRAVGGDARRLRDDFDFARDGVHAAAQVVRLGFYHQLCLAVMKRGRLLFAYRKRPHLRGQMAAPEHEAVGSLVSIEDGVTQSALFDHTSDAPHAV